MRRWELLLKLKSSGKSTISRLYCIMEFEWNPQKATANLKKHKISFREAATVFGDMLSVTVFDPDHSLEKDRYITIGLSDTSRLLMISHVDRGERIRIISARELTRDERKRYEEDDF